MGNIPSKESSKKETPKKSGKNMDISDKKDDEKKEKKPVVSDIYEKGFILFTS